MNYRAIPTRTVEEPTRGAEEAHVSQSFSVLANARRHLRRVVAPGIGASNADGRRPGVAASKSLIKAEKQP